jgi:5'(3')-deoxyribonucleotidase
MPKPIIFVDVDGILADLFSACVRVHNSPLQYDDYPPGDDDLAMAMGMTEKQFWPPVISVMRDLEFTPEAQGIMEAIKYHEHCILTAPAIDGAEHRAAWIRKRFPRTPFIITKSKHYVCSGPHTLLIDDRDHNAESWENAGGTSILFPRKWNKRHGEEPGYFPETFLKELGTFLESHS